MLVTAMLLGVWLTVVVDAHGADDHDEHHHHHHHDHHDDHQNRHDDEGEGDEEDPTTKSSDVPKLDPEELEYHKGSLCGYCEYCKVTFCWSWAPVITDSPCLVIVLVSLENSSCSSSAVINIHLYSRNQQQEHSVWSSRSRDHLLMGGNISVMHIWQILHHWTIARCIRVDQCAKCTTRLT